MLTNRERNTYDSPPFSVSVCVATAPNRRMISPSSESMSRCSGVVAQVGLYVLPDLCYRQ